MTTEPATASLLLNMQRCIRSVAPKAVTELRADHVAVVRGADDVIEFYLGEPRTLGSRKAAPLAACRHIRGGQVVAGKYDSVADMQRIIEKGL